ncbi:MAG: protein-methionine-sulfoxide reductase heme-binding subunit MsrQ [Pseudomonadota bacterium]
MLSVPLLKGLLWVALSAPLAWLGWQINIELQAPTTALGADPGEAVVHFLGEWAIRVLLLALSVTPLRQVSGFRALAQTRRLVGLFAFAYALLHFLAYTFFYLEFSLAGLWDDVLKRPYITVGMAATLCLLPLAITSTRGWQRRLRRNWQRLHRLVFPAAIFAVLHFFWLTRDQFGEVILYAVWVALLLGWRFWYRPAASRQGSPA